MFLNEFCFFGQIPTISFRKMRSRLLIHFSFQFKRKPSRENTTLKYLVGSKIERTEIQVDQNYLTKNFVSLNSSFEKFSISDVCPTGFCIRSAAWTSVDWVVQYSKNGFTLPRGCSIETLYSLFKVSFITKTLHEHFSHQANITRTVVICSCAGWVHVVSTTVTLIFIFNMMMGSRTLEQLFMSCPSINFQWSCMNWWVIINESTCQNVKLVIRALNMEKLTRIEEEICGKLGKNEIPNLKHIKPSFEIT